jgi:hypothetical protein
MDYMQVRVLSGAPNHALMVKPDITRVYETLVPDSSSGKGTNFLMTD